MQKLQLFSVLIFLSFFTFSQENTFPKEQLKFFLDCHDCDFTFVRQELPFISFVRNPQLADVHILSSESRTGSGGRKYFLNFIGMNGLTGKNADYEYLSGQSETDDDVRRGLLKIIKTGILHFYSITGRLNNIEIELEKHETEEAVTPGDDPWKLWIINIDAGSDFEKEESQNEYAFNSEIEIEKVTEAWKTNFELSYETEQENYFDDGEKISNNQYQIEFSGNYIKSLNSRWSAGIFGGYYSQTYLNIKNRYQANAGIEYNIFPWDVSNRKVFAFRYQAGINKYDYNEITIYDKLNENLLYQALSLNLEMVQPWGNIETRLEGRNYFHDFSKNRITFDSFFSIRLSRMLSIYAGLEANVVHDQLYLPKGDTSIEDLLLRRRKLATTYEISGRFGFRFTFGSIYNSVVNERF
jgi:hypothetical protein